MAGPDVVFLSAKSAKEAFGDENPIGKTLRYDFWGYQTTLLVKGIFADIPLNTSLERRPEAIISFPTIGRHLKWNLGWQSGGNYDGYLRLRSPQDADWLNERMSIAIARHIPPESGLELSVRIVPIHNLHIETPQVRKMIWIMFFLGIVLLFTTALNYVLVSVASLTQRAKAIGVHKCSGASGSSIFSMFMVETAIVVGLALLLIGLLVYIFHEKMEELAESLGTIVGDTVTVYFRWLPACHAFRSYSGDTSVPPLHFRASWLETGTAFCSVHRSGIHSGDDADGRFTVQLCNDA